ncbi:MAG: bifunctional folylpolyglutamate synthase/dihydrofolate synthase [Clostridia bacterium]|nr:bifunctional folylpolyglutamate synthase/dihydrofolate synthase [Clostridia bacterium]
MTYKEALKYIHGVSNFFCKPGLERIKELCRGLGDPQDGLKFIHVAGTNGKGSVCAMTDSILRSAGYKVGLYTSPYVLQFNERMRINGENIPDERLAQLTERVKAVAANMSDSPTEFELITAIAFLYFKEENCDIVVLEVGMGGRLDATNIINTPLLSVITGIAIDHTAFLGNTVEQIAMEKAGIIKSGLPVIFGGENSAAEAVIATEADKMNAVLYKTDYTRLKIRSQSLEDTTFDYKERLGINLALLGNYQPKNAAIALDVADALKELGIKIPEEAIRYGLANARWRARFEILSQEPTVIFDGAHNPQGITAAVESIKTYYKDKRVVIVSGVLADKDYRAIAASLSQVASAVYTITPDNPRALSAEKYAEIIGLCNTIAFPCPDIENALKSGIKQAKRENTALFCLGSLYTYCDVVEILKNI